MNASAANILCGPAASLTRLTTPPAALPIDSTGSVPYTEARTYPGWIQSNSAAQPTTTGAPSHQSGSVARPRRSNSAPFIRNSGPRLGVREYDALPSEQTLWLPDLIMAASVPPEVQQAVEQGILEYATSIRPYRQPNFFLHRDPG
jgi:hypothetical protein